MKTQQSGSLTHSTVTGVVWLVFQAVGSRTIGFLSQIILARILAPADFGVLGLALTVTTLVSMITTFGADDVLLQRQRTIRFWTLPAFCVSLALGMAAFVIVCVSAPIAANVYHSAALNVMLPVMGLAMPIGAVSIVSTVMLRAALRFKVLAKVNLAEIVVTQVITITMALAGFGALSFALPLPIAAALRSIALWTLSKPRFRRPRRGQYARMFTQGGMVFASRMVIACINQGATVVLGVLTTPVIVGTYFFASRLAVQPVQLLAGNFSTVLFPAMAQLKLAPVRQRDAALNASKVLAAAAMPYCFLQAAIARPIVNLAFGDKWAAAIPLIQILSVGLAFDAVSWIAGSLLSARGEFTRALKYSCIFAMLFFAAIGAGAATGAEVGVALAVSAYYVLLQPVYSYLVYRSYGVTALQVVSIYFAPAAAAAFGMGISALASQRMDFTRGNVGQLVFVPILGTLLYVIAIRLLAPKLTCEIFGRIGTVLKRPRAGTAVGER